MKHLNDFVNELKTKYYSSTMDERMFELNTWFLSFEQVLFLFNKAYSKNISFGEILKSIRTAAFMNGDFYSNYDYLEEIKKAICIFNLYIHLLQKPHKGMYISQFQIKN